MSLSTAALRVRPAAPPDAATCAALIRTSIRELCHADHGGDPVKIARWCENKTPETLRAWIVAPATRVFVAECAGGLAGVAAIDVSGEITLNYVAPHARFRGVSRALLFRLEAELAGAGVTDAHLDSTLTALRFYRSAGWTDDGPPSEMFGLPGQPMRKRLPG